MILKIKDTQTTDDVQKHFAKKYPYLQIGFFKKPHGAEEGSFNKHRYLHGTRIGDIRTKHGVSEIEIHGGQTTAYIEQQFEKLFGLHVQLYRKTGIEWIQTIGTDNLTIDEQNLLGRHSSTHIIHPNYDEKIEDKEY